ncbi:MAG: heme ABC exporter ATP-binding protein CcmA [Pseudomonadota bacterium]
MDLEISNLACRRAGRLVFTDLNLRLNPGEVALLRGPNGVGKSTLLRVLSGLLPPISGQVRLGDRDLGQDRAAYQEKIAYAGHLDAIKPALSIIDNLALWSAISGAPGLPIPLILQRFGLDRISDRRVAECSAGQKRRLGLARLLVAERPLWLLDEPTVSLDQSAKAQIAELVREHLAKGGLALIASHEDLGLGQIKTLEMEPLSTPTQGVEADPFLEGAW